MPPGPAARVLDPVLHPLPGMLMPGPGSLNTIIGGKLAWRGIGMFGAAALRAAKTTSDQTITVAQAATVAAAGTPGLPAAKAAEEAAKTAAAASMAATIASAAGGADIHNCMTPFPVPPHGPGVIIDGSPTVFINGLPACRQMDTILEPIGPPDKVSVGHPQTIIGDSPSYATRDEAARAALEFANPQSIAANRETGGVIYQNPDGTFGFSLAAGTEDGFSPANAPAPPGTTVTGDYHTHGDYAKRDAAGNIVRATGPGDDTFNSDNFSQTDLNGIAADAAGSSNPGQYRGYLGTPSGGFQVMDPNQPPGSQVSNF